MPDTLLRDSDFAMYQAKQAGEHHQVLDPASMLAGEHRGRLTRDLRDPWLGDAARDSADR